MKRYAVLVGVEQYANFTPTPYCHADVDLLANTLSRHLDYAEQNVLACRLSPSAAISPADLLAQLDNTLAGAMDYDTVLFYFAGHGCRSRDESFLILPDTDPADFGKTALPLRDVSNHLRRKNFVNVRIFDSCHSGADVRSPVLDSAGFVREVSNSKPDGWITLAACRDDEFSFSDPELGHGIFTHALAQALQSFPPGEDVLPELLKVNVCKTVANWANKERRSQTPTFNSAIAGNVAIAKRILETANSTTVEDAIRPRARRSLEERVAALKRLPRIEDKAQVDALAAHVATVRTSVDESIKKQSWCGASAEPTGIFGTYNIPEHLREQIVEEYIRRGAKSQFNIAKNVTYEESPGGISALITGAFGRKVKAIDYVIESSSEWPNTFALADIDSDGTTPRARIFAYIIPLQLSIALFAGGAIASPKQFRRDGWRLASLEFWQLPVSVEPHRLASLVAGAVEHTHTAFIEETERIVKYLEGEVRAVGID